MKFEKERYANVYRYYIDYKGTVDEANKLFSTSDVLDYIDTCSRLTSDYDIATKIEENKNGFLIAYKSNKNTSLQENDILLIKNRMMFLAEHDSELFEAINRVLEAKEPKIENKKDYSKLILYALLLISIIISIIK